MLLRQGERSPNRRKIRVFYASINRGRIYTSSVAVPNLWVPFTKRENYFMRQE